MDKSGPPPEIKAVLKMWCDQQRERYGEEWKKTLAKEMTDKTLPDIIAFLKGEKRK